jgi:hypothetical protein
MAVLTRSRSFGGAVIGRGSLGPAGNESSLQAVESSRIMRYATPVRRRCVARYAAASGECRRRSPCPVDVQSGGFHRSPLLATALLEIVARRAEIEG